MSRLSLLQAVQPKAGIPGVAQDAPSGGAPPQGAPAGAGLTFLLPLLLFVPILFMSFRRQKKESEARSRLKKGDRIVSQSGLIGELVEMDDKVAKVKIAPGTTVQLLAGSISAYNPEPAKQTTELVKDEKPAILKK